MGEPGDTTGSAPGGPRRSINQVFFYGILGLLILLVYRLFSPILPALLWGLFLSIICGQSYERLVARVGGRRNIADAVFGLILSLVVIIPAAFFVWQLVAFLPELEGSMEPLSSTTLPELPSWIAEMPLLGSEAERVWQTTRNDFSSVLPKLMSVLGVAATWIVLQIGGFGAFLFQFLLGALVCVFILHGRLQVLAGGRRFFMRVGGPEAVTVAENALVTTRATFVGVVVASIAQAFLVGIAAILCGLPVILFAGFTFMLALVQIGPFLVLVVADVILVIRDEYFLAALLTVWFLAVVMTADNIIRPYFSSRGNTTPGILSFLGAIGGFISWGLLGVFVGPVLASALYEMFTKWNASEPLE